MSSTQMADDIMVTEGGSKYDEACKKLLANKPILARIMKYCLDEYKDCDVKDIEEKYIEGTPEIGTIGVHSDQTNAKITGMSNEDISVNEGKIVYDIRFHAYAPKGNELIKLILNVEAQNQYNQTYPLIKRGIYYVSRMISSQYGTEFTNSHYEGIKKVYSIWICPKPPKDKQNTVERYSIKKENLIGESFEDVQNYDLLNVVMIHLGDEVDSDNTGIIQMLDVLLSDKKTADEKIHVLEENYNIPMTDNLFWEVENMCNLSTGIYLDGRKEGRAEGRKEGRAEGRAEGIQDTILQSIKSLMETMSLTFEDAAKALKLPTEDYEKYKKLLENK